MPTTDESGLRRTANYWVAETETADGTPVTPTDPAFKLYSPTVLSEGGDPSADYEEGLGLGMAVANVKHRQVESHDRTVNYELHRFPEDGSGNPQDPLWYAAKRDIDNQLHATLTHLKVVERASVVPDNTVHAYYFNELGNTHPGTDPGASSVASRTELYGRGGRPGDAELTASPSDSAVVEVELPMEFNKTRKYQIDQPDGTDDWIHIRSTASGDTNVSVTIEETDGSNSETISTDGTDGTVAVATSAQFATMRARVLDAHAGTIELYDDDGSGSAAPGNPDQLLMFVRGENSYDGLDYDQGIPLVGAGSFETEGAFPTDGIKAAKSAGTFDGSSAAQQVMGTTFSFSNNLESMEPAETLAQDIKVGQLEAEAESTVYGETESVQYFDTHMEGREGQLSVPLANAGNIVFPRAYVSDGGSPEQEAGSAVMEVGVTFRALKPSDGSDAVQFNPSA